MYILSTMEWAHWWVSRDDYEQTRGFWLLVIVVMYVVLLMASHVLTLRLSCTWWWSNLHHTHELAFGDMIVVHLPNGDKAWWLCTYAELLRCTLVSPRDQWLHIWFIRQRQRGLSLEQVLHKWMQRIRTSHVSTLNVYYSWMKLLHVWHYEIHRLVYWKGVESIGLTRSLRGCLL